MWYDVPAFQQKRRPPMKNRSVSVKLSLAVCIFFAAVLAASVFTFPSFFQWFYVDYHRLNAYNDLVQRNIRTIVSAFYACVPFAAAALYMLIRFGRFFNPFQ